jgi:hypothetical protein
MLAIIVAVCQSSAWMLAPSHYTAAAQQSSMPASASVMSLVRIDGAPDVLDGIFSQAEGASGIVALHFTERRHAVSNALVERAASTYGASVLYGGVACSVVEVVMPEDPSSPAYAEALSSCEQRGVGPLPCAQIWSKGELVVASCVPAELEAALVNLGASSATQRGNKPNRDFGASGRPSATAVDDIDFTGGAGNRGRPTFGERDDRGRTTGDFLPDLIDKPGDDMDGKGNGPPGSKRGPSQRGPFGF